MIIECSECEGIGSIYDDFCGDLDCCFPVECEVCRGYGTIEEEEL